MVGPAGEVLNVSCVCVAGAGKRHEPSEEAAGGAGGHEAALPGNRGEGGGAAGQTGAGRHQERAQQVKQKLNIITLTRKRV